MIIVQYSQTRSPPDPNKNVTRNVQACEKFAAKLFPLPHPSPRNNIWLKQNPWFEREAVPALQGCIAALKI